MSESVAVEPIPAGASGRRLWLAEVALGILLVALVGGGYWLKTQPAPEAVSQDAAMKSGLDAMYTRQLAKALDREGRTAEARPLWEKVLKMAEGYNDQPNLAIIRERLARKP